MMSLASLKQSAWRFKNKLMPGAVILMYHRVAEAESDPWSLCVSPEHFAQHLAVIQTHGYPMTLQQMTQRLRQGKPMQRSVAITFDDGYADNLHNAKPLLVKCETPATMFIATGGLGSPEEFWWDELERLLLQPGNLPAQLQLQVNGIEYQWDLENAADYSEADYQHFCSWQAEAEAPPGLRQSLYRELYEILQGASACDLIKSIQYLRTCAQASHVGRSTHRTLTPDEVKELETSDLIDIGAHTVTHRPLAQLTTAEQQQEIRQSKQTLEETLGHPIQSFSYPHGSYTEDTCNEVHSAGFSTACCSQVDRVSCRSHPLELPRIVVHNWDGQTFARWLAQWI